MTRILYALSDTFHRFIKKLPRMRNFQLPREGRRRKRKEEEGKEGVEGGEGGS